MFCGPCETHELSPLQPLMLVMIQILNKRINKGTYSRESYFGFNLITLITRKFSKGSLQFYSYKMSRYLPLAEITFAKAYQRWIPVPVL